MKNLITIFLLTLSVNVFGQDSKLLRTDHKYNVTFAPQYDSCQCELPYTSCVLILNQEDENAPVATVLENNTGYTLTWYFDSTGNFYATGIPSTETVVIFASTTIFYQTVCSVNFQNGFVTVSQAQQVWNDDFIPTNSIQNYAIEIRIY